MAVEQGIPFNRRVLRWARERRHFAVEDAAQRINVSPDRLAEWESGVRRPTVKQARKLAAVYDRPFLELFATEVPDLPEISLVPDYRFHRNATSYKEADALREVQSWAEETRLNALDLLEMLGDTPIQFPESLYTTIDDDVESVAALAREITKLPIERQLGMPSKSREHFSNVIRSTLESIGILVLRQSLLQRFRVRGICLYADPLPVIIYGNEAPGAQAFTLAHEFAHIILRQSAISGTPRFGARHGLKRVEGWCNEFAAAFLMPKSTVDIDMNDIGGQLEAIRDNRLTYMADRYAVSRHAMLIRLVTLGYVRPSFYWRNRRPQFLKEEEEYSRFARPRYYGSRFSSSRGNYYTGLVLQAWNDGFITNHNAAEFMGIKKLSHLTDIRSNYEA